MFKIFYLSNCGYSKKALETLNKYKLADIHNQINCDDETIFTSDSNNVYIPSDYSSYPKILYIGNSNKKPIFIGGSDELEKLFQLVTTPDICNSDKIPSQRFIDRRTTCKILLKLEKQIKIN